MKYVVSNIDCTVPSIETFTNSNLKFCQDEESAKHVFWELNNYWNGLSSSPGEFDCPVPCSQESYKISMDFYHKNKWFYGDLIPENVGKDYFALYVYFSTLAVEQRIENLDFDFESFLAAIGGNLGLFLGFSCLSVLLGFVRLVNRCYCKSSIF